MADTWWNIPDKPVYIEKARYKQAAVEEESWTSGKGWFPETPAKKRGRKKKSKVLNLICRLYNYKESVCLFIKNLCVPFDNNQAERDLRMVKVKTKVSGCFRNEEGAQEYLTIMSYIGSARKHGINAFTAIREALNGTPDIIFN